MWWLQSRYNRYLKNHFLLDTNLGWPNFPQTWLPGLKRLVRPRNNQCSRKMSPNPKHRNAPNLITPLFLPCRMIHRRKIPSPLQRYCFQLWPSLHFLCVLPFLDSFVFMGDVDQPFRFISSTLVGWTWIGSVPARYMIMVILKFQNPVHFPGSGNTPNKCV